MTAPLPGFSPPPACGTTFEPDDSMIEVGIKALELVLPEVKGEDAW